jgi:hypothetical protein
MIKPAFFGFNEETADSNVFQRNSDQDIETIRLKALDEFTRMTELLSSHDIDLKIFQDDGTVKKPDAIFPNNWVSFHEDGRVILYPMLAPNRRKERRRDIIDKLANEFTVTEVIDLSDAENQGKFLEGTGSLVFDHANRIIFACQSPRTHPDMVQEVASLLQYRSIIFKAFDNQNKPIYHTNVMMCVGKKNVLLCLDAIPGEEDQDLLLETFAQLGHKVIAISYAQMNAFAGNVIEVQNHDRETVVLLSKTAFESLLPGQVNALSLYAEILPIDVGTIEKYGGGSVRCMIAGIHLPKK